MRSMISLALGSQTDISLPLQPESEDAGSLYKSETEIKVPDQAQLDTFRNFLASARGRGKLRVPRPLAEVRYTNYRV